MSKRGVMFALVAIGCTIMFLLGIYMMIPQGEEPLLEERGFLLEAPIVEPVEEPKWELTTERIGSIISMISFGIMAVFMFVGAIHLREQATKELYKCYSRGEINEEEFYRKLKKLMNDI